jgi:hypothetical protein
VVVLGQPKAGSNIISSGLCVDAGAGRIGSHDFHLLHGKKIELFAKGGI